MDGISLAKIMYDKTFNEMLGKYEDQVIAEKFGCTRFFVTKFRRHKGIKAYRNHKYHIDMNKYAGKMTDREVSQMLKCNPSTVTRYRKENGIPPFRRRSDVLKRERDMIAAYERLGTLQKVADEVGITRERVRQILIRAGYTKRNSPRGRRK
jgi:DNA-directed RNA polymerase sigma subunit (sigma70/sigma32)